MNNKVVTGVVVALAIAVVGYFIFANPNQQVPLNQNLDATPKEVTLSGTYVCLPHLDTTGPQTEECAFGLKADSGEYYAVNFGASADAMNQFQSGIHIIAEGNVVIKEALSSDHWAKYNMKGIFTITKMIEPAPSATTSGAKLNINVVCEEALAYMSFPDAASAEVFVTDCKAGKHPEVIEQYKKDHGLGDGAAI